VFPFTTMAVLDSLVPVRVMVGIAVGEGTGLAVGDLTAYVR